MPKPPFILPALLALLAALPTLAADTTTKPREYGTPLPLPVDQRIERQNSPADKLVVEITRTAHEGSQYVAYVKVVWGDLDNVIKTTGKQYYSDWDGSLKLTGGATGMLNGKIQFDDAKAGKAEPGPGSGRDEVEKAAGATVEWKAGVVGVLDGLRIKITSPTPTVAGTLTAGKFTIPLAIAAGNVQPLSTVKPAASSTVKPLVTQWSPKPTVSRQLPIKGSRTP